MNRARCVWFISRGLQFEVPATFFVEEIRFLGFGKLSLRPEKSPLTLEKSLLILEKLFSGVEKFPLWLEKFALPGEKQSLTLEKFLSRLEKNVSQGEKLLLLPEKFVLRHEIPRSALLWEVWLPKIRLGGPSQWQKFVSEGLIEIYQANSSEFIGFLA